jgi:hypothetical protein
MHFQVTIDPDQFTLFLIIIKYGDSLGKENIESFLYRFFSIIGTLIQFTTASITTASRLGWRIRYMVRNLTSSAKPPSAEALH